MMGIGAGSLVFAILYPAIEGFYLSSPMDGATLPKVLGIGHWAVMALVYVMAAGMFFMMERYERGK
jgi:hypothetical protein